MQFPLTAGPAFFFETLLPGILAGIVAYPLFPQWAKVGSGGTGLFGFISLSLLIGVLPRLFSYHLGLFWMGVYWVPSLRRRVVRDLELTVNREQAKLANPKVDPKVDPLTGHREFLFLDSFPEVDKKKVVFTPTVLGTIPKYRTQI